jgi:hypothetical protein
MTFALKKGDLVYATDGTLGFVSDVYRVEQGNLDEGWAAIPVPGVSEPVYITSRDVQTRDEAVPSVLLRLTYAEATAPERRHAPVEIASGTAQRDETPLLEVGRPELPGTAETLEGTQA